MTGKLHRLITVPQPIRVVLIEDQRQTREGLAALIGGSPGTQVVARYGSGEEALADVAVQQPDVILTDLGLPGIQGVDLVATLRRLLPDTPIMVLTVHGEDHYVFDALCAGACGYLYDFGDLLVYTSGVVQGNFFDSGLVATLSADFRLTRDRH